MTVCQMLYLFQVKLRMGSCSRPEKDLLLKGLSQEIEEYAQHLPRCTMGDLREAFQSPKEAAEQLLEAVPVSDRLAIQRQKWIIISGTIVLLAATVIGNLVRQMHLLEQSTPLVTREKIYVYVENLDEIPSGARYIVEQTNLP